MRLFSALPNQQRRRPTHSSDAVQDVVPNPPRHTRRIDDDETIERRRRRRTGEILHRPIHKVSPESTNKAFMVVPVRLRDIDSSNPTCLICHEDYKIDCTISFLPCGHVYHAQCIHDWLQRKSTCCVCRYELPTIKSGCEDLREYLKEFQNEIPDFRCNSMNPLADTTKLTYKVS